MTQPIAPSTYIEEFEAYLTENGLTIDSQYTEWALYVIHHSSEHPLNDSEFTRCFYGFMKFRGIESWDVSGPIFLQALKQSTRPSDAREEVLASYTEWGAQAPEWRCPRPFHWRVDFGVLAASEDDLPPGELVVEVPVPDSLDNSFEI